MRIMISRDYYLVKEEEDQGIQDPDSLQAHDRVV
jgi:hypothetical protein